MRRGGEYHQAADCHAGGVTFDATRSAWASGCSIRHSAGPLDVIEFTAAQIASEIYELPVDVGPRILG